MPPRDLCAPIARVCADQDGTRVLLVFRGEIEVRRQQRARLNRLRRDQLRHFEDADGRVLLGEIGVRERAVGGAEIDADRVLHSCLTENSSFQARPPDATSCISSVPTSVTCERR